MVAIAEWCFLVRENSLKLQWKEFFTILISPSLSSRPPGSNPAPGLQRSASRVLVSTATALAERKDQLSMCEDNSSLIISKRLVRVAECRPKAGIYRHLMSDDCPTAGLSLSLSPTPGSILAPAYRGLIVRHSVPSAVDLADIFHENLNSGDHFTMSQTSIVGRSSNFSECYRGLSSLNVESQIE